MRRTIAFVCVLALMAALLTGCGGGTEEVAPVQKPGATTIKPGIAGVAPSTEDTVPAQKPAASQGNYTVYVQVTDRWEDCYLWAWSTAAGDLYEAWPGEPMKQISDCWYAMDIPVEYDWVIANDNGREYIIQTDDICTGGEDAWIILDNDTEGYLYNDTDTLSGYEEVFETMQISDEKKVSDYLNSMAAIRELETGLYMEMEFGFNSSGVQEFAYTFYYDLSDMTPVEVSEGVKNIRSGIRELFGHIGCLEIRDEIHNDILVVALHFRGMDDAANAREMVAAVSEMAGMDASGMLDRNGRVILDSVFTLEEAGADVKLR